MSRDRERFEEIFGKKIKRESSCDHHQYHASSSSSSPTYDQIIMGRGQHMVISSSSAANSSSSSSSSGSCIALNTITPCAACKLLRRRCAEECPFSPYFSPHEPHKFAAVHKVFGASNVSKMLLEVPEIQRADAANSLVYEANLRLRDPVYGCMGAISSLQQQIQTLQAELSALRSEILKYRYREASLANFVSSTTTTIAAAALVSPPCGTPLPIAASLPSLPPPPPPPTPPPPPSVVVSNSSSSSPSSTSLFSNTTSTTGISSIISNDHNVAYFD